MAGGHHIDIRSLEDTPEGHHRLTEGLYVGVKPLVKLVDLDEILTAEVAFLLVLGAVHLQFLDLLDLIQ